MSHHKGMRWLAVWMGFVLFANTAVAQDETKRPLTEQLIGTLHRVGLSDTEVLAAIEKNGIAPEIDPAALRRLGEQGVSKAILSKIESLLGGRQPAKLSVMDILAMHEAGIEVHVIRERIVASPEKIPHQAEDIIRLASKGVPEAVLRAIREHDPSVGADIERSAAPVTVEDLIAMARLKLDADQMLERIRRADSRFSVVIDDLITLSREQVPQEVINEVWARRILPPAEGGEAEVNPANAAERPAAATTATGAFEALLIHREPAGGFSLIVPAGWHAFRDNAGRNDLLSLSDAPPTEGTSLANSEIQVLRVRAKDGEANRLVPQNLESIAKNFLARLQANYATKGMTLAAGPTQPLEVSGQPAMLQRLSSTDQQGTTHEGELIVTFKDDQVFLVTYAIRADLFAARQKAMQDSLRSFTFEFERPALPNAPEAREQLRALYEIWHRAVTTRDYGLFRQLLSPGQDSAARRSEFVALCERLDREDLEIRLGTVDQDEEAGLGRVHCRLVAPRAAESLIVEFQRTQQGFRLK